MMRPRGRLFFLLLLSFGPAALGAQEARPASPRDPGESLTVSLITIGQGPLVWERFGHNAILIQDEDTGWERAYHWGVFSFQQVDFIPRLIRGTMLYGMGASDLETMLREYQLAGRPVWIQELALTPSQKWELLASVEENYRPENREYRYDYYQDNCSTRARDALDGALGGLLGAQFSADTTDSTFRWHTRRILRELPAYYLGIQFVLGPRGDHPITVWEEMFLPPTLMERIREVRVPDGVGGLQPLVRSERVLLDPGSAAPPTGPPFVFPVFLAMGILFAGSLLWLVGPGTDLSLGRRLGVATMAGGWGFVAAVGGSLLLGAWIFTDHVFWYANFNLFQVNPLHFPLPVAFLLFLVKNRFPHWGMVLAVGLGAASLLGVALEILPGIGQKNLEFLAFSVPVNGALWMAAIRLHRGGRDLSLKTSDGVG